MPTQPSSLVHYDRLTPRTRWSITNGGARSETAVNDLPATLAQGFPLGRSCVDSPGLALVRLGSHASEGGAEERVDILVAQGAAPL